MAVTEVDAAVALRLSHLTVSYGSARGIVDISMDVPDAGVTGLLGSNGAGKTTLLRAALDLVHPTSGSVSVRGVDSRNPMARSELTYLPGDLVLPGRLNGWAVLRRYTAGRAPLDPARVRGIADRLEIDLDRPVAQLSKGNRQKVGLLLAFAPRARLLMLDEPTSGLDPLLQREFGGLVREATSEGAAILLSSHVLSELEDLADRVAVLREGSLVAYETIDQLRDRAASRVAIRFLGPAEAAHFAARDLGPSALDVEVAGDWVRISFVGDVDPLIKAAAPFHLRSVESIGGDLDDVLMSFYGSGEGQ